MLSFPYLSIISSKLQQTFTKISQEITVKYFQQYNAVPPTPLLTSDVLKEENELWPDVQVCLKYITWFLILMMSRRGWALLSGRWGWIRSASGSWLRSWPLPSAMNMIITSIIVTRTSRLQWRTRSWTQTLLWRRKGEPRANHFHSSRW